MRGNFGRYRFELHMNTGGTMINRYDFPRFALHGQDGHTSKTRGFSQNSED